MILQVLLITTLITSEPSFSPAMPVEKIEASRKRGKKNKGRRRGGNGLR